MEKVIIRQLRDNSDRQNVNNEVNDLLEKKGYTVKSVVIQSTPPSDRYSGYETIVFVLEKEELNKEPKKQTIL